MELLELTNPSLLGRIKNNPKMNNPFDDLSSQIEELKSILLEKLANPQPASNEADDLLTIEEAAEMLRLAVPTIYGLVSRRTVPYMKKGKRLFFSKKELTQWLKTGRRKTSEEIAKEADRYTSRKAKGGVR